MSDISYDAKMSSKSLTEFTDQEQNEDENDQDEVNKVVVESVVDVTRRTTIQGMSVKEIHRALQGKNQPSPSQDAVVNAVNHLENKGWLKQTGFFDDEADAEGGLPRLTNKHFWKQTQRTRQQLLDDEEEKKHHD